MEKQIEKEPYYHGLLPREDMKEMLKKNGDFLLRMSEPQNAGERAIILSLMVNEDKDEGGVSFIPHLTSSTDTASFSDETFRHPKGWNEILH